MRPVDEFGSAEDEKVPFGAVYSIAGAARLLAVSYTTVWRLIQRRKLRCLGSIRHKRIPRAELERFIREDLN